MRLIYIYVFLIALFSYSCSAEVNGRFYPRYHLAPPHGWMNDPNGFSIFKGLYHLFYQYNPVTSQEPGIAHWANARSVDLFHWEHLPIAMSPDKPYDIDGVFSGSAIVENDTMFLYYTGNVNHANQTPDHEQHQALATSTDGVNVVKYENNPIIIGSDRQPNFRDPKVWKHNGTYYMVLGNSFNNDTLGRVLLYSSTDRINWNEVSILLSSTGFLGYMFECPDFFELDGKYVLLFSPQGIQPQGDSYRNLYQTGYIVGTFDYVSLQFDPITEFKELDHGHDFYATQTISDNHGRRIMFAWLDMWEQVYPERNDGWTGQMSLPRKLTLCPNNHLNQNPVSEVRRAIDRKLYSGRASAGTSVQLVNNTGLIKIKASESRDFELHIETNNSNDTVTISYDHSNGTVTLNRGGNDGVRRTTWQPTSFYWRVYVDASSIELFCGKGEVTFSSRYFPYGPVSVRIGDTSRAQKLVVHSMKTTVPQPGDIE